MSDLALLITCEHAVNHVPQELIPLFADCTEVLWSHRAFDQGAAELARHIANTLSAPLFEAKLTRLLVDHNRSPHNRSLWSEFSRGLPASEKLRLLDNYYRPFRDEVAGWISESLADECKVVHVSVHSFTPVLDGKQRAVDVGLLYDPGRTEEGFFADVWKSRISACRPDLRVRFNVPYRGCSDGHMTSYRALNKSRDYVGIELEINQALVAGKSGWPALQKQVADSLKDALVDLTSDE
jgi:predicted N-formylglutamate amidohydrolase